MDKKEIVEMCHVIFTSCINSEISNTTITKMVNFAKTGALPFKANSIDGVVYDSSTYDLGVIDLGEYMIYDSLRTCRDDDEEIVMTRYLRFTKGEGENIRELDVEL